MRTITGALLLTLSLAGCSAHGAVAGPNGGSSQAAAGGGNGWVRDGGPGLVVVALPDPSFGGMVATFVAVPKGWKVEGQMGASDCTFLPDPVWHASAPDGKSVFDMLPRFGWRWGAGAQFSKGCSPFKGALSGQDFLKAFAAKLPGEVRIVGDMPVSDHVRSREENFTKVVNDGNARMAAALQRPAWGDVAAVRAVDGGGHELRLRTWIQCRQNRQGGDCFAKVDILQTAKGQLDALADEIDQLNLTQEVPAADWLTAYMQRQQRIAGAQFKKLTELEKSGSDMLRKQFEDSSALLNREHAAGMEQIARQGKDALDNDNQTVRAMTTAASDWRDYAADQQTVSGANGTYKTSSQYSNVWSSPYGPALSGGRTFGATDNTLNPNTATDNSWTPDVKVHGNGQQY